MSDLPQLLLVHLQREARDARVRARASGEETEQQIAPTTQQLGESHALLECLKRLQYGV
jgi:hypothetical protein